MEKKDKKYTLKVKGKEVEVNEEIYRAYIRPVQAEQRSTVTHRGVPTSSWRR